MAYIIGLAGEDQIKELERRGWEVEDAPKEFTDSQGALPKNMFEDCRYIMIFVDNDLFSVMDGPDWEKG